MQKGVLLFILMFAYFSINAQNVDIDILRNINKGRNNSFEGMMEFTNNSNYFICGAIPIAQLVTGVVRKDRLLLRDGVETLIGIGYATVVTYMFKYSLQRDRPYVSFPELKVYQFDSDPSFPSGHTSIAFSTATTLSICYPKWYVIAPAYIWAGTVGYSQMYLGVHYPTDVLFGAIIGAGSSWLSLKTTQWMNSRKERKTLMSY